MNPIRTLRGRGGADEQPPPHPAAALELVLDRYGVERAPARRTRPAADDHRLLAEIRRRSSAASSRPVEPRW